MATTSLPRIRRLAQNTQYTYNLGRRIHDVKSYPIPSPQGATVLIYGHESGVTIVWRGGKRLKNPKQQADRDKRNGAKTQDAVMIIDSDDEASAPSASTAFVDKPEFGDVEAEDENGYPEIIQTFDLGLGTAATHVAVLPLASDHESQLFRDRMVFAVSCATTDVYLVTLPLTPPSHQSKLRPELKKDLLASYAGKGKWGETMSLLGGQNRSTDGIAMTLVQQKPSALERQQSSECTESASSVPRVVVAAHSREAGGTLRFWDVPLDTSGRLTDAPIKPFQTEYLPSSLTAISFNPTQPTKLLVTASPHAVRIYDYALPSLPQLPDDATEGPFPPKGSWLLSLYPPFSRGSLATTSRKPIVDSAWISHGRAILTLLADGQWGIWDLDGGAPSSASGGLFGKSHSGIRGTAITVFSVSGFLEGTSPLRNPGSKTSGSGSGGEFVPMTPHTRRESSITARSEMLAGVRGGIEVVRLPARASNTNTGDESAVLWMGGADHIVAIIPRIARFWEAQVKRGAGGGVNLFSGTQPSRMIRIPDLGAGLVGERCSRVGAVVRSQNRPQRPSLSSYEDTHETQAADQGLPVDVLVLGESRIVFVRESEEGISSTTRLFGARKRKIGATAEPVSAIIVQQGSDKQSRALMNLAASHRNSLRASRAAAKADEPTQVTVDSLFRKSHARPSVLDQSIWGQKEPEEESQKYPLAFGDEVTMTQSMMVHDEPITDFQYIDDLERAADMDEDDVDPERDVEDEIIGIMEIDRALDELQGERDSGRKHVFFESE